MRKAMIAAVIPCALFMGMKKLLLSCIMWYVKPVSRLVNMLCVCVGDTIVTYFVEDILCSYVC